MVSPAQPSLALQPPQRLTADSRMTKEQFRFAELFATGLNSASNAYRLAYKRKSSGEWWCRQCAYRLLQKPHIQALVTKLKAQFDSVRPALTRLGKREILHGMAIDEALDPMDRQRAVDIDNKMQGEYAERLHLTGDVHISMFRPVGAIPWQLAETVSHSDVKPSPTGDSKVIDGCVTTVPDGGTGTLAIHDSSQSKALSSDLVEQTIPSPAQAQPATPARKQRRKLKPVELAALRKHRTKR